jgi:predicted DCC family thiol-disulfide oxidoreductase YuxK
MSWQFKLLYDGECPICRREVDWLRKRDRAGNLAAEDISALGFDPSRYGLTRRDVAGALHGLKRDGTVLSGMDAVRESYRAVGLGWLLAPTRLPGLKLASELLYRLFARNRIAVGRLLGRRCPGDRCGLAARGDGADA